MNPPLLLVVLLSLSSARAANDVLLARNDPNHVQGSFVASTPAGCKIWDPVPDPGEVATWTGACDKEGYARGEGTVTWLRRGEAVRSAAGAFEGGYLNGRGVTEGVCPGDARCRFTYRGDHWLSDFDGVARRGPQGPHVRRASLASGGDPILAGSRARDSEFGRRSAARERPGT